MIPIVEDYLSELMEKTLDYIRVNPEVIDKMFGAGNPRISRLKSFVQNKKIQIIRGYPRTSMQLPCFCILLSGEEETQEGLGDYVESEDSAMNQHTEQVTIMRKVGEDGQPTNAMYFRTKYKPLYSITSISHNELGMGLNTNHFEISNVYKGEVTCYDDMVELGDTLTVEYTYRELSIESNSTMFDANYRIETWADNADQVVELYHLCKWILVHGRDFLGHEKSLYRQRISGADFEPAPNFFPDFVYRRALMFWCQVGISVPTEDSLYITDINVSGTIEGDTGQLNLDGTRKEDE